ncbi:MAG: hypothetical protein LQ344_007076 [Seirophora lacunosa]|nr:MAG: hypothetical protein LQ344_007076 [Seirophora lacunosa]
MPPTAQGNSGHHPYSTLVYRSHSVLQHLRHRGHVEINGETLDIPSVVAVSKFAIQPILYDNEEFRARVGSSVATLDKLLSEDEVIYGVTTGFGGSADVRTRRTEDLQSALLQHHQFGVLTEIDKGTEKPSSTLQCHAMPSDWVKGTMLVRCNTLARGHSAVTLRVIETIVALLKHDMVPVVPLRGTISASGDLSPLSYIAGVVTGSPDIYVRCPNGVVSAEEALREVNIGPCVLGPKEGLGLMNGTATSAAVASLALYRTHHITILSQVLTAMAIEALHGTVGSFDPFLATVRPHGGQRECAASINHLLQGSRLARGFDYKSSRGSSSHLFQDRYALRTASQWIGPQIEDLTLAHHQITIELNSTTDNPLVDVPGQRSHHGGNFQAASITSAMEKTRLALQMIGKLLFAQSSELLNPMLNHGLPPNLAADEPSMSFMAKGVDIGMASYMSELAFLANPVSSHVQSAEMHNQAVNSLAFISARYTLESVDLVSLMSASYLYTLCQALDLRVLQKTFLQQIEPALRNTTRATFAKYLSSAGTAELLTELWANVHEVWHTTHSKDTHDRIASIIASALATITRIVMTDPQGALHEAAPAIRLWKDQASTLLLDTYTSNHSQFFAHQTTPEYLGLASRKMYLYVRETLKVPFHRGLEDHPTPQEPTAPDGRRKRTIGSWISVIYESLRDGEMPQQLMDCLSEAGLVPAEDSPPFAAEQGK